MSVSRLCHCGRKAEPGSKHCRTHKPTRPKDTRPTAHQRGYDAKWQRIRRRYLAKHPTCAVCGKPATDVDHIDGYGPNGPRGHDESNLRSLCHSHHSERTARDQPGGFNAPANRGPLLIICGGTGTGKTQVRFLVASALGAASLGPDDYDGDWTRLLNALDRADTAVVECCQLPRALRRKAKQRKTFIVQLVAKRETRRQRLIRRGEDNPDALLPIGPLGYEDHVEPDLMLDTDRLTPYEVADATMTSIDATWGGGGASRTHA